MLAIPRGCAHRMRYDLKPDSVGWTIVDVTTGRPVLLDDLVLVGIDHDEADRLVDLLNAYDLRRETAAGDGSA